MANFKVGDRVRVISQCHYWPRNLVGMEGVVLGYDAYCGYRVHVPGAEWDGGSLPVDVWPFEAHELAPLVDPDTWALEAVRKVTTPNRQIAYDAIREEAKRELQETLREQRG